MDGYSPISDYKIIGDLYSAALVSESGDIDWLCLPNFDSPSVFAAILDSSDGGTFQLHSESFTTESTYIPDTAIINTACSNADAGVAFKLHDFMLPQPTTPCENHILVRMLHGKTGTTEVNFTFNPEPDYGRSEFDGEYNEETNVISAEMHENRVSLYLPDDAEVEETDSGWEISTTITANEQKKIALEYGPQETLPCHTDHRLEEETETFWKEWIQKGNYFDFCKKMMKRSAITLKLLQHNPSGGLVAAPTTSLPEEIGGKRNWDYRYVWMRDATYTLYSLNVLDLHEESNKFFSYIENILLKNQVSSGIEELSHFYTISGNAVSEEEELTHLDGYEQSRPIRVGNSASDQFQLDSYGVLIDAFYLSYKMDIELTQNHCTIIKRLVSRIAKQWDKKDNGIWEVRKTQQHYTYSKVMCWVGIDRALRMQDAIHFDDQRLRKLRKLRDNIKAWIWNHCFDEEIGGFRQHPNIQAHDATSFLFPLVQFLDKDNRQTKDVIENTRNELCYDGIFAYRYKTEDGLQGEEGAFLLCTFWMISAYAKIGEVETARMLLDELEKHIDDSGLMSEEIDPVDKRYLGNFPQAFSHMGYIMSAHYIDRHKQ